MKKIFTPIFLSLFFATSAFSTQVEPQTITLDLNKPANPTSFVFEETTGRWVETFNVEFSYFESQVFMFSHLLSGDSYNGSTWDGFTVGSSGDNSDIGGKEGGDWVKDHYGCMPGGGIKVDEHGDIMFNDEGTPLVEKGIPYLVGYWSHYHHFLNKQCNEVLFNNGQTYIPQGVYIANSPWVYYAVKDGSAPAKPFDQEGDCFELIATGFNMDNDKTGEASLTLAEFKDGALSIPEDWMYFDLTSLGEVAKIEFTMSSTDEGGYGPNTPTYFCLDKLSVKEVIDTNLSDLSVSKASVFPSHFDDYLSIKLQQAAVFNLIDMTGKNIITINLPAGESQIQVDRLPKGMYVAKVAGQQFKLVK